MMYIFYSYHLLFLYKFPNLQITNILLVRDTMQEKRTSLHGLVDVKHARVMWSYMNKTQRKANSAYVILIAMQG